MSSDLDFILGAVSKAPGLLQKCKEVVEDFQSIGKRGERAYEKTHWGRRGEEPGTWAVDAPDPRTGLTEMGRLVAIEYLTRKGRRGAETIYRHEFDTEPGQRRPFRVERLPILAFTFDERPSGLVVVRDESRYTVTAHGIEH